MPEADETYDRQHKQQKILLDVSLFTQDFLDPRKVEEEAPRSPFSLEIPGALLAMIQAAQAENPDRLYEFLYAYLLKMHQDKKPIKLLGSSITDEEKDRLRTEAKQAVDRIINDYAPLIEGAVVRPSERWLYSEGRTTHEEGFSESGEESEPLVPRYPIQTYDALIPVKSETLIKLQRAYAEELGLPANQLYDMYFLQVYHGLRYGLAASPEIQRPIASSGNSTNRIVSRFMSSAAGRPSRRQASAEPGPQTQSKRETLWELLLTYFKAEWLGAITSGAVELTLSYIRTGTVDIAPWIVAVGLTSIIEITSNRLELTTAGRVLLLFVVLGFLLVITSLLRQYKFSINQIGSSDALVPPSLTEIVYLLPPTVLVYSPTPAVPLIEPLPTPWESGQLAGHSFCTYVVQPGDTPQAIVARFQVSEDTLRLANPPLGMGVFRVHQKLMISAPCCRPIGGQGISHTVQRRETLYSIARRYGTTLESIAWANHIYDLNYIQEGQMLCIPY